VIEALGATAFDPNQTVVICCSNTLNHFILSYFIVVNLLGLMIVVTKKQRSQVQQISLKLEPGPLITLA
jgi:hypothetical protein